MKKENALVLLLIVNQITFKAKVANPNQDNIKRITCSNIHITGRSHSTDLKKILHLLVITKVITFVTMQQIYQVKISKIGNSRGVRLPKELVLSLGTSDVILERTSEGILIKPSPIVPPLNEWAEIFAKADTSSEPEFEDWDITLNDGEDEEEV